MRIALSQIVSFVSIVFFVITASYGQSPGPAVGKWRALYSYYTGTAVAAGAQEVYGGSSTGFYTYNLADHSIDAYSKVNGMNDVGIVGLAHEKELGYTLIAYKNSNMDIFKDGYFTNLPDILTSSIPGDKSINHVYAKNGNAYISTPLGLHIANLKDAEVAQTTPFFDGTVKAIVTSSAVIGDTVFVSTSIGVFKSYINNPFIQDYSSWAKISNEVYDLLVGNESGIYALRMQATHPDTVFTLTSSGASSFFYSNASRDITTINIGDEAGVWIAENYKGTVGNVSFYTPSGMVTRSASAYFPSGIAVSSDGRVFFTDKDETKAFGGLREVGSGTGTESFTPDGPESMYSYDVWAYNGEVWVAHGGHRDNWLPNNYGKMFSSYIGNQWRSYANDVAAMDIPFLSDATQIIKDRNSGSVFVSMAVGGLIELTKDGNLINYKHPYYDLKIGDPNIYIGSGAALDANGNLWLANYGAANELRVRTKEDEWYSFHAPGNTTNYAADMVIDDYNNKWYLSSFNGGLVVYSDEGTISSSFDDRSRVLRTGKGSGNLPSNMTYSIAKDLDGAIWVGTNNGIGIIEQPMETLEGTAEAELRVVEFEGMDIGGYLFSGISVKAIEVDGNNNKWIGTVGSGAWLISDDGREVIHKFNTENSPLPSNDIESINIDPVLGDVYISTSMGIMVYRGTATAALPEYAEELFIYPNPVPSGFGGQIAIRGLKERSDIRITDVSGQLVYQFSVEGGQAVWNGRDYTGRKPQSGVYLVIASDRATGKVMKTGKVIIHE